MFEAVVALLYLRKSLSSVALVYLLNSISVKFYFMPLSLKVRTESELN